MNPQWPVYIVSKGRSEHGLRLTSRALEAMRVPYSIVVEAQEAEQYAAAIDPAYGTVRVLDPAYQRDYDACDDLGDGKSKGPGPARNFVWDHAAARDAAWHWVMDDNIWRFYRHQHNLMFRLADGTGFRIMEDFCARYENVSMAGPNYYMFTPPRNPKPPFLLNTRIYSCNLIRTDAPFRWRGRYNEDTDLSLRMLKSGWCTAQYNAFIQWKTWTQHTEGGNTAEFYVREGTRPKSEMLVRLHPDVARLTWRFGRWHHHVDYRPFKANRLRLRPDVAPELPPNEYGLVLKRRSTDEVASVTG